MEYWRIGKPHPSIPSSRRSLAGFTLIEVLVSIIILAAIVGLMTVAFRQASNNWTYGAEEIDAYKLTRTICDQIGIELEQAIVRGSSGLEGSSSALEFYCSMDPPTTNTLSELRRVRYERTSSSLLNALIRSEELYDSSGLGVLGGSSWDTTTTVASNQIRNLSFQYASASSPAWSDTWPASSNLPAAVKIALTVIGTQTARRLENLGSANTRLLDEYQVSITNIVHLRNAPVN